MRHGTHRLPALFGITLLSAGWSLQGIAQDLPGPEADPGVEERRLQQVDPDRYRPVPQLEFEIPAEPPMEAVADAEFQVSRYEFRGNTAFSDAELAEIMAGARGTVTFRELLDATAGISTHYRDAGFIVARAYIPEQPIDDGVVEIAVLEGVLGEVRFDGDNPITRERAASRMERLAANGLINEADLEYGALLLNDLPGMSAAVALRPGEQTGTSDVVLDLEDEGTFQFAVDYNNFGTPVTGEHRFGVQMAVNNLFNAGDRFTARPIVSETGDTVFGSLAFDMPLFTPATRVGLRASHLLSELGEDFEELEIENVATTMALDASHAFIRSRNKNFNARFAYEYRSFERECGFCEAPLFVEADEYELQIIELGINGDWRDERWGGGINTWHASVRNGLSELEEDDEAGGLTVFGRQRAEGKFVSLQLGAQRLQRIADLTSLSVRLDGQYSGDDLDSSERISLGGPGAVRAYRPSEALGDSGLVLQTELRREIPFISDRYDWLSGVEGYLLLDAGVSELNDDGDNISRELTSERSGAGLGIRFSGGNEFYIDLAAATRLADRESNVDQPDDEEINFWAQAIYWF